MEGKENMFTLFEYVELLTIFGWLNRPLNRSFRYIFMKSFFRWSPLSIGMAFLWYLWWMASKVTGMNLGWSGNYFVKVAMAFWCLRTLPRALNSLGVIATFISGCSRRAQGLLLSVFKRVDEGRWREGEGGKGCCGGGEGGGGGWVANSIREKVDWRGVRI